MLTLNDVACRRDGKLLFERASLVVHPGQKVGLTGANGTGKSSLFAMIRGVIEPDDGEILLPRGVGITHVAQETPGTSRSALDHVVDGDARVRALEAEMAALGDDDGVRHAALLAEFDEAGGWSVAARAGALLNGLGFAESVHADPVSSFSGGWRMRLNLAQALLSPNELLLLDEPTNHLDLDAVLWLEEWLKMRGRHPRADLPRSGVPRRGDDAHAAHRARHRDARDGELHGVRAPACGQAREPAGRPREGGGEEEGAAELRRSLSRQGHQGAPGAEPPEDARAHGHDRGGARPTPRSASRSGRPRRCRARWSRSSAPTSATAPASRCSRTCASASSRGDRIGLLGANGAGKSTLVKALVGELEPEAGERTPARKLVVGYFAQHQVDRLRSDRTPLQALLAEDPVADRGGQARSFLGGFGFEGDRALQKAETLSGGERARLALALIVHARPNLLLLDEPTNHLDIDMRQALADALQLFEGALLVISHDRVMLRSVVDGLWLVSDRGVGPFDDDLDGYARWLARRRADSADGAKTSNDERGQGTVKGDGKEQATSARAGRRASSAGTGVPDAASTLEASDAAPGGGRSGDGRSSGGGEVEGRASRRHERRRSRAGPGERRGGLALPLERSGERRRIGRRRHERRGAPPPAPRAGRASRSARSDPTRDRTRREEARRRERTTR